MSTTPPTFAIVWVIYGTSPEKRRRMQAWAQQCGASLQIILNNSEVGIQPDEQPGSNRAFEFSGYLEGLALLPHDFRGPVLVVNDTLLANHWAEGWGWLLTEFLKLHAKLEKGAVYGDWRPPVAGVPELQQPFYASWIFWCVDRQAANFFKEQLELLLKEDLPPVSTEYNAFIKQWLSGKSKWKGWHQKADGMSYARKAYCIRLEHRLSQQLSSKGQIMSFGRILPWPYRGLRWIDRARTFLKRW